MPITPFPAPWMNDEHRTLHDSVARLHVQPYADARVQRIYGGTSEIMKELAARSI